MVIMSKYDPLWKWINENKTDNFKLTYAEIENIAGVPIDHSFLRLKKELLQYGFQVAKISMKEQTVDFEKVKEIIVDSLSCDESQVTMEANLKDDLEADSLDAVELIMQIEEEFEVEIPDEVASNMKTVKDIVDYIEANK